MPLSRRTLLTGSLPGAALLWLACAKEPAPSLAAQETVTPTVPLDAFTPTATRTATATATPPPPPPALSLPAAPIPQGGVFLAGLSGAGVTSAWVEFGGRWVGAVAEGDTWLAIVPTGQGVGDTVQLPAGRHPLRLRYEQTGRPGVQDLTGTVMVSATAFPVEALTFTPGVSALLDPDLTEQEAVVLREVYGTFSPRRLWDGFFTRPSPARLTDVYGSLRSYNGGPATGSHSGVDFGAFAGQPVVAAARGRVVLARPLPVRGNMVILDHGAGVLTGYSHLSRFGVEVGQEVGAGGYVGAVGATGLITGPHLHWEVVAGGRHVDGLRWLQP